MSSGLTKYDEVGGLLPQTDGKPPVLGRLWMSDEDKLHNFNQLPKKMQLFIDAYIVNGERGGPAWFKVMDGTKDKNEASKQASKFLATDLAKICVIERFQYLLDQTEITFEKQAMRLEALYKECESIDYLPGKIKNQIEILKQMNSIAGLISPQNQNSSHPPITINVLSVPSASPLPQNSSQNSSQNLPKPAPDNGFTPFTES